jgi:hypothetical protein
MDSPYSTDAGIDHSSLSSANNHRMIVCKNPGCEEESPEFYPKNKTMCKKCVAKRNKERKEQKEQEKIKARQLSKKAEKLEAKLQKQKEKTKQIMKEVKQSQKLNAGTRTEGSTLSGAKQKPSTHSNEGTESSAWIAIIASQQKMIEYQQKQADHLFALTEKILSGAGTAGSQGLLSSSARLSGASTAGMDQRSGLLSSSAKQSASGTASRTEGSAGDFHSPATTGTPWRETLAEGMIPATPRRYPRLSHGKNRLN